MIYNKVLSDSRKVMPLRKFMILIRFMKQVKKGRKRLDRSKTF